MYHYRFAGFGQDVEAHRTYLPARFRALSPIFRMDTFAVGTNKLRFRCFRALTRLFISRTQGALRRVSVHRFYEFIYPSHEGYRCSAVLKICYPILCVVLHGNGNIFAEEL